MFYFAGLSVRLYDNVVLKIINAQYRREFRNTIFVILIEGNKLFWVGQVHIFSGFCIRLFVYVFSEYTINRHQNVPNVGKTHTLHCETYEFVISGQKSI